ncbi:hypothetical protein FALBO_13138 [Fusarium albosuccineum]|uniref:F-box domain-containing protein n=1 Tax=Fusarium albosuccineum TaxID=1237068 RepID=A0A8H4L2T5_9HYPO|nr:hypothetical protein FALBO_13138 [Fusarium albosuccineum]
MVPSVSCSTALILLSLLRLLLLAVLCIVLTSDAQDTSTESMTEPQTSNESSPLAAPNDIEPTKDTRETMDMDVITESSKSAESPIDTTPSDNDPAARPQAPEPSSPKTINDDIRPTAEPTSPGESQTETPVSDTQPAARPSPIFKRSYLATLPVELLLQIGALLAPLDRACLSFTCRHAYDTLGSALRLDSCCELSMELPFHPAQGGHFANERSTCCEQFSFLRRLERDGTWLSEFLCQTCRKFHPPCKGLSAMTPNEKERPCIVQRAQECWPKSVPSFVDFDLVAMVMRSSRHNSGLYGLDRLALSRYRAIGCARIFSNTSARIVDKRLILKSETYLFAGHGYDTLENVPKVWQLFQKHIELGKICQHVRWGEVLPFIFSIHAPLHGLQKGQSFSRPNHVKTLDVSGRALQKCIWTHPGGCWARCKAGSKLKPILQGLWSCESCSTDYKISTAFGDGKSSRTKFLVLTSWKNLGRGEDAADKQWREFVNSSRVVDFCRMTALYSTASSYEQDSIDRYQPSVPRRALDELG